MDKELMEAACDMLKRASTLLKARPRPNSMQDPVMGYIKGALRIIEDETKKIKT